MSYVRYIVSAFRKFDQKDFCSSLQDCECDESMSQFAVPLNNNFHSSWHNYIKADNFVESRSSDGAVTQLKKFPPTYSSFSASLLPFFHLFSSVQLMKCFQTQINSPDHIFPILDADKQNYLLIGLKLDERTVYRSKSKTAILYGKKVSNNKTILFSYKFGHTQK